MIQRPRSNSVRAVGGIGKGDGEKEEEGKKRNWKKKKA